MKDNTLCRRCQILANQLAQLNEDNKRYDCTIKSLYQKIHLLEIEINNHENTLFFKLKQKTKYVIDFINNIKNLRITIKESYEK